MDDGGRHADGFDGGGGDCGPPGGSTGPHARASPDGSNGSGPCGGGIGGCVTTMERRAAP